MALTDEEKAARKLAQAERRAAEKAEREQKHEEWLRGRYEKLRDSYNKNFHTMLYKLGARFRPDGFEVEVGRHTPYPYIALVPAVLPEYELRHAWESFEDYFGQLEREIEDIENAERLARMALDVKNRMSKLVQENLTEEEKNLFYVMVQVQTV